MNIETLPWHLDQEDKDPAPLLPMPTGTRLEQARILLERNQALEKRAGENALDAERAGDTQACWFAMATRSQARRFIETLKTAIAEEESKLSKPQP